MFIPENEIWVVVVGFLVAFILAFGIGANDVANSFGTSVGSKVLTLKTACVLATLCEISGAVLLGAKVSNTIRSGIVNVSLFAEMQNGAYLMMLGLLSSLIGSCLWLLVATFFRVPVSGTHSIVGATIGFALIIFGGSGIKWMGLIRVVVSWFVSPLLSGAMSVLLFYILKKLVLTKSYFVDTKLLALLLLPGGLLVLYYSLQLG